MNASFISCLFIAVLTLLTFTALPLQAADAPEIISLWPKGAPGETAALGPEHDTSGPDGRMVAGKPVIRIGNVSSPIITVYRPPAEKDTGAAVLVCPGGGYSILAYDLEGTEVCQFLNSIGVTGILLKYRVPARAGQPVYTAPLQDAQRALGIVRSRAKDWGLKTDRIGILGFSAGGHLSAALSTNYLTRTYPVVDGADAVSCRPDFVVLIYPAYLTQPAGTLTVAPELQVTADTPPTFIAQTEDDATHVTGSIGYYLALKNAKVPAELHLFPTGGHGYGLRAVKDPITTEWPRLLEVWLRHGGFLASGK